MKWRSAIAVAVLAAGLSGAAEAQEQLPRGRWWRNPDVARNIALTEDQQKKLDAISRDAMRELIDVRATIEKAALTLRDELEQTPVNREAVQKAGAKLMDARAQLFERELMMLVDMRGVLNAEQWTKVRNVVDRERAERPRLAPGRPAGRPGAPQQPPAARRPPAPAPTPLPDERRP